MKNCIIKTSSTDKIVYMFDKNFYLILVKKNMPEICASMPNLGSIIIV